MRPHIVWFGEAVPMIQKAIEYCKGADVMIIIGTSMQVYPAAGLIDYVSPTATKYYIDPFPAAVQTNGLQVISEKASHAVPRLVNELIHSKI